MWAETPATELQIKGPSVCGERPRVLIPAFIMTPSLLNLYRVCGMGCMGNCQDKARGTVWLGAGYCPGACPHLYAGLGNRSSCGYASSQGKKERGRARDRSRCQWPALGGER